MKKGIILTTILALGAAGAATAAIDYTKTCNYAFDAHSPLSEGNWVRISIDETGVYEIPYERLREMGFADPSKVAVYGQPGHLRDDSFVDAYGYRLVDDNLRPMAVMHTGSKLIFYGRGVARIDLTFEGWDTTLHPRHKRTSRSPYSDKAYYFLTDSSLALGVAALPAVGVTDRESAYEVQFGYAYHYHEEERQQGLAQCGPLFWGDVIKSGQPASYRFEAPYCAAGKKAAFYGEFAGLSDHEDANLTVSIEGKERMFNLGDKSPAMWALDHATSTTRMTVDSETHKGEANLTFSISDGYSKLIGVDYWTMSYPMTMIYAKEDPDFTQQYICFPPSDYATRSHALPAGTVAWDITAESNPRLFDQDSDFFYLSGTTMREAVVFNPQARLLQIGSEYSRVANQDLHAEMAEGAELVIFSTETLLPYARRIAALHEQYDGIRVLVVTPQQVFDEFTSGTPDPMAYRLMCKMLHQSPTRKLKNALVLGPVYADYRNLKGTPRPEGHLIYSQLHSNLNEMPIATLDYLGAVTDRTIYRNQIHNARIRVGVGLLNVSGSDEAEMAVRKIEDYLSKQDFSGMVNETMTISCAGDVHIHDNQAIRLDRQLQTLNNERLGSDLAHRSVWLQGAGEARATAQIKEGLGHGKLLSTYFGHAGSSGFTGMNVNDMLSLDNREPGFMMIGACTLSSPDLGLHGMGDMGVIGNRRGFAGVIASTRSVMSNHNEELIKRIHTALVYDSDNLARTETPTIGEVLAIGKDKTANESEVTYVLIGDPALHVPFPLTPVEVTVDADAHHPGDIIDISGRVLDMQGKRIKDYNGYVTVKIMEPSRYLSLEDEGDTGMDTLSFRDGRLVAVKGEVTEGRFAVRLSLPESTRRQMGTAEKPGTLRVLAATYNPATRLAASGAAELAMAAYDAPAPDERTADTEAPELTLTYDPEAMALRYSLHDNIGMLPGVGKGRGLVVSIDGHQYNVESHTTEGCAVTDYEGLISVAHLGEGTYKANYKASDVAGNSTGTATLRFTVSHPEPMALTALSECAVDEIAFRLGQTPGDELEFLALDSEGNVALRQPVSQRDFTVDLEGLAAGAYRAAVRHASGNGAKVNSNWVRFTVID